MQKQSYTNAFIAYMGSSLAYVSVLLLLFSLFNGLLIQQSLEDHSKHHQVPKTGREILLQFVLVRMAYNESKSKLWREAFAKLYPYFKDPPERGMNFFAFLWTTLMSVQWRSIGRAQKIILLTASACHKKKYKAKKIMAIWTLVSTPGCYLFRLLRTFFDEQQFMPLLSKNGNSILKNLIPLREKYLNKKLQQPQIQIVCLVLCLLLVIAVLSTNVEHLRFVVVYRDIYIMALHAEVETNKEEATKV